ncbi:MAG: glycosyltransferase, partial [Candidatus Woesearchaeota archaeon]
PLIDEILSLKNVRFLGSVPYSEVGSRISEFDIAFIPYKVNKLTDSVTSLKLYEYLSLGLPIVTTNYSEAKKCKAKLFFIDSDDAFEKASLIAESDLKNNFKTASEKSWLANTKKIIGLYENINFK